jgi:hypothetical protein
VDLNKKITSYSYHYLKEYIMSDNQNRDWNKDNNQGKKPGNPNQQDYQKNNKNNQGGQGGQGGGHQGGQR